MAVQKTFVIWFACVSICRSSMMQACIKAAEETRNFLFCWDRQQTAQCFSTREGSVVSSRTRETQMQLGFTLFLKFHVCTLVWSNSFEPMQPHTHTQTETHCNNSHLIGHQIQNKLTKAVLLCKWFDVLGVLFKSEWFIYLVYISRYLLVLNGADCQIPVCSNPNQKVTSRPLWCGAPGHSGLNRESYQPPKLTRWVEQ